MYSVVYVPRGLIFDAARGTRAAPRQHVWLDHFFHGESFDGGLDMDWAGRSGEAAVCAENEGDTCVCNATVYSSSLHLQ